MDRKIRQAIRPERETMGNAQRENRSGATKRPRANPLLLYGIPTVLVTLGVASGLSFGLSFEVPILWSWLISINLVTFLCFGIDKRRAIKSGLRIPEKLLFFLTLTGGGFGALSGMKVFRHKRAKSSFVLIFWLIIVLQIALVALAIRSRGEPISGGDLTKRKHSYSKP